ncbi:hypothetical protein Pst134EA_028834 [Puccinia striiformis f. sp. tritici]|uniref:hypothetical protein n=1 Tax=Puccinia striiformis f. sp. tritici TaxID=168172 RepID=UPI0020087A7A|nr:hypothetical protein Pst134EA_028834 [Puccinia striiformis f. sp. tritici]KAH9446848.1 hypothetical protein Pst134EA_028834 [Puccinia striiformis f. sp. tritici]
MAGTGRHGYRTSRGPIIRKQTVTTTQPTNLEAAINMAQRQGFLVIHPSQLPGYEDASVTEPVMEVNNDTPHHEHYPRPQDSELLPPEPVTHYALQHQKLATAWKSMKRVMSTTYFVCQYKTQNWTTTTTYIEPFKKCTCPRTCKRTVDLIHTHGTNSKERLIIALRKQSNVLATAVNTYNHNLEAFRMAYPQGPQPLSVEYDDLISMEPDNLFWNDGIYTYHQEAWVVDSKTQDGMRLHACLAQGEEEVLPISLEIRRSI